MNEIDILFELGTEEIPSGYITPAKETFYNKILSLLKDYKLSFGSIKMYSTPRRLAFYISALQERQNDEIIERVGPSVKVAYDDKNNLTKAALGFLKSAGATEEDIYLKKTPKGEKIAVKKELKGKKALDILNEKLPEIIYKINFPKTMKWGAGGKSFARPIRWILALQNDKVWDFNLGKIKSSDITYGNRFLGLNKKITVKKIDEYEKVLEENFVIPDSDKRKNEIKSKIINLLRNTNLLMIENNQLINEVNNLIEFPTPVIAEFDRKYLKLPEKIIISTLSKNQKYFALQEKDGSLSEKFVFISNGNPDFSDIIKVGNQKVVKARLEDAEFYFNEDTKHSLEYYVPKLQDVLFHKEIGNLFEKTQRIVYLSKYISEKLQLETEKQKMITRAAYLCKADLVTHMLGEKEFTKLQGYIGSKYALISGEKPEVAKAILEHYMPKSKDGELPDSIVGAVVAIADKIDTVCSIFSVNQIPTGSNDPFALRRAAIGVVKIIDKFDMEFDIFELIDKSYSLLGKSDNKNDVYEFFKARIIWYLGFIGITYDIINSISHIRFSNIPDTKRKALAIKKYKTNKDFEKLVIAFKRVSNIIQDYKKQNPVVDETIFEKPQEKELYLQTIKLEETIYPLLQKKQYLQIMEELVRFSGVIDLFFDKVLVNTDDVKLKENRYALLSKIRKIFLNFADLNKLD